MGFQNSVLFIISVLSLTINQFVAASDVLNHGDELSSLNISSNLVSTGGKFTLGFFKLTRNTQDFQYLQVFTYLGIWFNDNDERKVWVANRDIPMTSSGSLVIDDSGTLKVIRRGGKFTNTTMFNVSNQVCSSNTRAVLKDSGNLVVYDAKSNRTLWQSFDYPTDTLLPGMKLGYNLTTGQNWTLTSWLTDMIPAPGAFTLRLEHQKNSYTMLVIQRHGMVYWSGGYSLGEIIFSDDSGVYIAIDTVGISMLQLSYMGELIDGTKIPIFSTLCYGSHHNTDGCLVSSFPNCREPSDSLQLENGNWDGDYIQFDENLNISLSDCMERCWIDCNCLGVSTSYDGTGCIFWVEKDTLVLIKPCIY